MTTTTKTRRAPAKRAQRPQWQRITKRQREEFLEHTRDGLCRPDAAARVGSTAKAFKALARFDDAFGAAYAEAEAERRRDKIDWLEQMRDEAIRAGNTRMLHYESMVCDPNYRAAFQKSEIQLSGNVAAQVEVKVEHTADEIFDTLRVLERVGLISAGPALAQLAGDPERLALLAAPAD